ncbi:phosphate/phosphite/phosphonate ABC transporter substrate-binding protein [Rubrobacter aplysinae]|uniref:phosphate/phosphite/phosphonate ABC transporter substrate-binding protein n=1 Tax=Rubrobacter aplysinae TaxID=909625 RepID=UPI00064BF709|nr:phosphate/phosphite/phosphonate ABC transporter substrate-binding protein [Rubrobacter aplysinae]
MRGRRNVRRAGVIALGAISLALVGCGSSQDEEALSVGLIPNQNPEEVQAQYQPLEEYLSGELDRPVELEVPTSYNAVVEAMTSGELDLAYFGGLTYAQARERADISPLVTEINPRTGDTKYRSAIIAPANGEVEEVEDIEGKDFAFGSASSTSGSLYPSIMLDEAGVDYRTDLGEYTYTGGHDATAQAVANERVAAGGLEYRILLDLVEQGTIDEDSYRVIQTILVEGYPWVVRDDLPENLREEVAQAYLDLEDPELLDLLRAQGYERVEPGDYDEVEEQARELDLLTPTE